MDKKYQEIIQKVECNLYGFLYNTDERYIDNLVNTIGWSPAEARSLAAWDWTHGVGLYGLYKFYEYTKDEKYLKYIEDWFEDRIQIGLPDKNVNTVAPLLTMACLYEVRPNPRHKAIMQEWADWIMNDMRRTEERGIQHEHAELENNQELWDDTLFMTVLFLTKYGRIFNRPECIEEAIYQLMLHAKYLLDTRTGLWYHGWSFAERGNFAKALWGRGNCWITIFIPEFLEMVELKPRQEEFVVNLLRNQVETLSKYQSEEGMWHTLIDDPSSYLEASATAGFCYGILKGVRKGYLNKDYLECGRKALKAVLEGINEEGELMRVSYGTNVGRTLQHYKDIPLVKMHYGQSLALLALIEGLMQQGIG